MITGATFTAYGWKNGYFLVISVDITIAIVSLTYLFIQEIREYRSHQRIVNEFIQKEEKKPQIEGNGPT
jgi:hypothetical protein